MSNQDILLCHMTDLPTGTSRGLDPFEEGRQTMFAIHDVDGVRVFWNKCPHEGTPLGWRRDAFLAPDGLTIMCFAHGARFDKVTGICLVGPCVGQRLASVPFSIDGNGALILSKSMF
jgi:nitrite reductase/ring-hydroxylating ferredoxin subunit